jgi:hypothetical protein
MRGIRRLGGRESAAAQVGGNGLTVGTAGAAAEVFNVIFCHVAQCNNGDEDGDRPPFLRAFKPITGKLLYDPDTVLEFL